MSDKNKIPEVECRHTEELEEMITENKELLSKNNQLLNKIHRSMVWGFWLRILWVAIVLGLPFLLYYYLLAPYYESFQDTFEVFGIDINQLEF